MARKNQFLEINRHQFESLCGILCTIQEIAGVFNCDRQTILRWCRRTYKMNFQQVWDMKSAMGKMSIRRLQFEKAKEGNTTMLIWLGKQYLGQTDKADFQMTEETKGYVFTMIDAA